MHYYFSDHLGSTSVITNATGTFIEQESDYYPYGRERVITAGTSDYKFTGKERDTETGLDYFGARYYGSNMGRWMSPDWAGKQTAVPYADFGDPQTLNLYGYVRNNPLWKADLDGHGWWQDFKTAARNTVDNIGIGFLTLVLQPDKAVKGTGQSLKTAAKAYGTKAGREQLKQGVTRELVMESLMTATASVAPGAAGGASSGGGFVQSLGNLEAATPAVGQTVFRVWGGKSGPYGQSWTPVDPGTVGDIRSAAGLPNGNTATQTTMAH